jgi:hypothetical protein
MSQAVWDQTYAGRVESPGSVGRCAREWGGLSCGDPTRKARGRRGGGALQIDPQPYQVAVRRPRRRPSGPARIPLGGARLEPGAAAFRDRRSQRAQRDDALSAFELAKAALAVQEAALESAQLNLSYTTVRSPSPASPAQRRCPSGSLVTSSDRLTTVNPLDPVYVTFSLPEGDPAFEHFNNPGAGKRCDSEGLFAQRRGVQAARQGRLHGLCARSRDGNCPRACDLPQREPRAACRPVRAPWPSKGCAPARFGDHPARRGADHAAWQLDYVVGAEKQGGAPARCARTQPARRPDDPQGPGGGRPGDHDRAHPPAARRGRPARRKPGASQSPVQGGARAIRPPRKNKRASPAGTPCSPSSSSTGRLRIGLAIVILLAGVLSMFNLPIALYPDILPPRSTSAPSILARPPRSSPRP